MPQDFGRTRLRLCPSARRCGEGGVGAHVPMIAQISPSPPPLYIEEVVKYFCLKALSVHCASSQKIGRELEAFNTGSDV